MTASVGRACGKVILLGEHAVVYGIPAIAVGIDRGASAFATEAVSPSRLLVPEWDIDLAEDGEHELSRAFRALLAATGKSGSVRVEARADLPPGGGLGCSAALGVAIARALDPNADAALTATRAMAWERIFHGNPSGVDAAVAAGGGCVLFEKGEGDRPNSIEPIHARGGISLVIGHSGLASSTKLMVEAVARVASAGRPRRSHALLGRHGMASVRHRALRRDDGRQGDPRRARRVSRRAAARTDRA